MTSCLEGDSGTKLGDEKIQNFLFITFLSIRASFHTAQMIFLTHTHTNKKIGTLLPDSEASIYMTTSMPQKVRIFCISLLTINYSIVCNVRSFFWIPPFPRAGTLSWICFHKLWLTQAGLTELLESSILVWVQNKYCFCFVNILHLFYTRVLLPNNF